MNRLLDVPPFASTQVQGSSANSSTTATLTPPAAAVACTVAAETTSARVTFNGTTPSAANGVLVSAGATPLYLPFAVPLTWRSSGGTASLLNVVWEF